MANNIKGITIELGGNVENLNSSLKGVNKTAGDLQSELKQVQRQLKFNPGNTELLNQKAKILKESISATEQKLKDLKSVQGQVEEQFKNGDLGEEKYRAFQREVEQTEDKLKSLKKQAADFGSVAGQKFQIAGEKIQNTGEKISGVGQKFMPVSAAAAGAGIAAVKMADDFESGMAKVSTIADTTQVPIGQLKQSVMDLSDQTGISTTELTEGLYQTISAGVQTKDAMNVLGVAVKTAKGGFTDTSTAINTLTSAMNAYHMKASDAAKVSDTLIATQNVGKTTVGELGQSLGNVIPTAAAAGVKFTDLMGSIAELTKQGMPTSEAITGIKTAISNVIKPSADASKEAAKLGLDFSEAHMKNVGLPAFLQEVQNKTGGNITTMGKLFGSVEGLNAVTALTGKNQKDFAKTLDSVGKSAGTTNQAFGKMESTGATSAEKAMNSMKNAITKLGEALAPLAEKIAGLITQIGQKLQKLTPAQKQMIAKVLLLTAALAPLLTLSGKIVKGIGTFTIGIGKAIKGVAQFHTALQESQGLFAALKVSLGPGGIAVLIIAAIALLVVGIKHLWDTNKQFRDGVMSIWNGIKGFFTGIPGFFTGLWSKISGFFSRIPAFFKSLGNGIKSGANGMKSGVVGAFNGVKSGVLSVINGIKTGVTTAFNGVKTAVLTVWNGIRTAVMTVVHLLVKGVLNIWKSLSPGLHTIMSGIKNMLSAAWTIIKNVVLAPVLLICDLITGNFGKIPGDLSKIWTNITNAAQTAWTGIQQFFTGILQAIVAFFALEWNGIYTTATTVWNSLASFFTGLWASITGGIRSAWNAVKSFFSSLWASIVSTAKAAWNGLVSFIQSLPGRFLSAVQAIGNAIKNGFQAAISFLSGLPARFLSWGSQMISGLLSGIRSLIGNIGSTIRNGFSSAISFLTSLPGKFLNWGRDMIQGLINGITGMIGAVGNAVSGVANKIRSFLHFSRPDEGPLVDYESWMPDMMEGIARGIINNLDKVGNAAKQIGGAIRNSIPETFDTNVRVRSAIMAASGGYAAIPSGGPAGNSETMKQGSVNVTQYIYSKTPSPSEQARQTKNALRKLALGF